MSVRYQAVPHRESVKEWIGQLEDRSQLYISRLWDFASTNRRSFTDVH